MYGSTVQGNSRASRDWRRFLFIALVLVLVCGCLLWCWPFDTAVPAREVLLDESAFLQRAVDEGIYTTPDRHGAREYVGRTFSVGTGTVVQEIYRYRTKWSAAKEYERQLSIWFPQGEWYAPWVTPTELNYQSEVADQFFLACGTHGSNPLCGVLARYGAYLVRFSASGDAVRYDELAHILAAMDNIMEANLSKKN